jgi:large conductance mechanosensitive channel
MIPDPKSVVSSSAHVFKEFKDFISRGNVVDLAIGLIMGAAFGKIVTALVSDIIMPPIGLLLKGIDFKDLFISLDGKHYATIIAAKEKAAPIIAYGNFVNIVIEFMIVSACVFLLVKTINTLRRTEAEKVPALSKTEELLAEIRDSLKK